MENIIDIFHTIYAKILFLTLNGILLKNLKHLTFPFLSHQGE